MNRDTNEINRIIKNGGFYFTNKKGETTWNSIVTLPGDNRLYRKRVETLVVRNNKEIFVKLQQNGNYFLPGGSTEKDVDDIVQAENECHEESHLAIKNIKPTGITYIEVKEPPRWAVEENMPVVWNGYITEIYIAEYDSKYTGHIDPKDEDPFIRSGRFYPAKECMKFFRKEHKEAFSNWMRDKKNESSIFKESYITNYFKNKKFLKEVGYSPEIAKSSIDKLISMLKKSYRELSAKSSIKREIKRKDVNTIFHPVCGYEFADGNVVTLVICFDENSDTPAAATTTEDYGDLVITYPEFFKLKNEHQIYVILHEIGHVRLQHITWRNSHHKNIFGEDDTEQHRVNAMMKNKVTYPELYADMYAILHGAKMYAILNTTIQKDDDDKYMYSLTNKELANRYIFVTNNYNKFKKPLPEYEGCNMTNYDITMYSINQLVQESGLSYYGKNQLKNMMFSFSILRDIREKSDSLPEDKNSKEYIEAVKELYNEINIVTESTDDSDDIQEYEKFEYSVDSCKRDIVNRLNTIYESLSDIIDSNNDYPEYYERCYGILHEWKLTCEKKYEDCPDNKFGIPETRSFPLNTKQRVESACKMFHFAPDEYKKSLARRIRKAMKEYDIPLDFIGPKAEIRKYL